MKRIFLTLTVIFYISTLSAQAKQSVRIYNFENSGGKKGSAHYATIIPDNIRIELDRTEQYEVIRTKKSIKTSDAASIARSTGADFIITGEYNVLNNQVAVTAHLYITGSEERVSIPLPAKKVGVFLNEIIDNLALKISFELQKHLDRSGEIPLFEPKQRGFEYYAEVILTTKEGSLPIYYTLDGSTPNSDNGTPYVAPFEVYDDVVVKAVSQKSGAISSEVAAKKYYPLFPVSLFECKMLYGVLQFASPYSDETEGGFSSAIVSVVPTFYFGGIDSVKSTIFRNIGVGAWLDFGSADFKSGHATKDGYDYKIQGYSGGLFFKFHPFTRLVIEIPATIGSMTVSEVKVESTYSDIFAKSDNAATSNSGLYYNGGILLGVPIGFFQLNLACMVKSIDYTGHDRMNSLAIQAGFGVCF